ncbi:outer membrane beta-barrel protein [Labilibacter marinus]|uniref:outer membrane beta-barrel protein n=1 Tax=Labilibacter marinus TaxID=1477105 RepID=UPI00082EB01B|nr:outer membrane beta-barrel protein [Labilibacter marinus]
MKKVLLLLAVVLAFGTLAKAQEESDLEITGSVDAYFKYDFSGQNQIGTSFADEHNSMSIGMIDLGFAKSYGKASFYGELSFGPRSYKSIPGASFDLLDMDGEPTGLSESQSVNIQNLYMSYALSESFSLTAGYMGTFVGYEVISPAANFNYSTSYLFSAGPFQNAGLKADWAISDKVGLMVGLFNDWNYYYDMNGISDIGAQLSLSPVEGWDAYINFLTGPTSGTVIDLTTGYQITDDFYFGLNAADYTMANSDDGGYYGVAFYPQYSFSDKLALGYRGEFFASKDTKEEGVTMEGTSVFSSTATLNFYHGPFTFSTEVRMDSGKDEIFTKEGGVDPTKSATQFLFAAIYSF